MNFVVNSLEEIVNSIPKGNGRCIINEVSTKWDDFHLVTYEELNQIIYSMPNKGSPNEITAQMIKENIDEMLPYLINIINSSLESGVVPNKLKMSTIIPIRKKPNTIQIDEFRPINTLPTESKLVEKIVTNQLEKFISEGEILIREQSAFRKNHGCESAIQYTIEEWKNSIDENLCTAVVFLDLKRAFETISRERLLDKLCKCGIGGRVYKWFKNYLTDRKQIVKIGDTYSDEKDINYGVPQGSVLGPLLFVLYMNDIGDVIKYCRFHLFADDMLLFIVGKDKCEMERRINEDLQHIWGWLNTNKLKINVKKTKAMVIGTRSCLRSMIGNNGLNIEIEGQQIEIVERFKYLGVIIDPELKFNQHVDYVCKKISKKLGVLRRCSGYLSLWSRKLVYNTIVLPHFNYMSSILYLANKTDKRRLQLLQNRGMRAILKCSRYTSVRNMLGRLQWLKVDDLLEVAVMKFVHKCKLKEQPEYCVEKLTTFNQVHGYHTRHGGDFIVGHKNKKQSQNSVFYRALLTYNKLPQKLKECKNMKTFKNEIMIYYDRK